MMKQSTETSQNKANTHVRNIRSNSPIKKSLVSEKRMEMLGLSDPDFTPSNKTNKQPPPTSQAVTQHQINKILNHANRKFAEQNNAKSSSARNNNIQSNNIQNSKVHSNQASNKPARRSLKPHTSQSTRAEATPQLVPNPLLLAEQQEYLRQQAEMLTDYMIKSKLPDFYASIEAEVNKQMEVVVKRLLSKNPRVHH